MLKINHSPLRPRIPNAGEADSPGKGLGVTSKEVVQEKKVNEARGVMESTSAMATGVTGVDVGSQPIGIDVDPMLVGIVPANYSLVNALYRDIYYNDAVGGSSVDLMSSLPFGDFSLGGIEDDKILSIYNENIERLSTKTLMPEMSTDYLVLGGHCHSLLYNKEKRMFVDVMPYAPEHLKITTLPFYSQDPIIEVTFPETYRAALAIQSPHIERLKKLIGEQIFEKINEGTLELDPLSTVYIPRRTFSDTDIGTSYFRRLLPWYLIEKNLHRGTLVESARRQRGIMHLTLGDGEQWIPTPQDTQYITELFMNADTDPLGAIIATRSGIMVEEIRQGGDFWKVNDFSDAILPHKLRALQISEAFLSGDANYQVADNSLTIFVDMLRSYREMMTRKFFYEKIFPMISLINGITVTRSGKIQRKDRLMDTLSPEEALYRLNDGSRLLIPSVTWAKQLKPEGDSAYMEMLETMTQAGIPIPLRVRAAAGGLNLDEMLKQKDEDIALRKKLKEYNDLIAQVNPPPVEGGGEGGDEGGGEDFTAESSANRLGKLVAAGRAVHQMAKQRSAVGARKSLLTRNFEGADEMYNVSPTGKKSLIIGQRAAKEKVNRRIARAVAEAHTRRRMAEAHTVSLKE